jgi:YebC/PmpR family DNA-binding regulatory protein
MSGHSKWSTIKRKKGKLDAARGRVFTKLIREITVAARNGGGDANGNPTLRSAMIAARAANMPMENIERAIRRGTGEEPGVHYDEAVYEAFAPGGTAILIKVLTDNKNRTSSEIRHILTRHGARMGEPGSVSRLFMERGVIEVPLAAGMDEDAIMAVVLDAGADDLIVEDGICEIKTAPENLEPVREALEKSKIAYESAEVARIAHVTVRLEGEEAKRILKVMEALEEQDDVQKVFANFDIPESMMEEMSD